MQKRLWRWGDLEMRNPFDFFPWIFCLNMDNQPGRWQEMQARFTTFGIEHRIERFRAIATPENHHRGCALSWRAMVAEADRRGYEYILIFEDDAVFLDATIPVLRAAIREVSDQEWDLFFLGAVVWSQEFPLVPGCTALQECGPVTASPASAIHRRAFARILADIPTGGTEFEAWMLEWKAIDQYYSRRIADGTFRALITTPRVATQPALRYYADADLALGDRYVI